MPRCTVCLNTSRRLSRTSRRANSPVHSHGQARQPLGEGSQSREAVEAGERQGVLSPRAKNTVEWTNQ